MDGVGRSGVFFHPCTRAGKIGAPPGLRRVNVWLNEATPWAVLCVDFCQ
jgi:hypothetical protein